MRLDDLPDLLRALAKALDAAWPSPAPEREMRSMPRIVFCTARSPAGRWPGLVCATVADRPAFLRHLLNRRAHLVDGPRRVDDLLGLGLGAVDEMSCRRPDLGRLRAHQPRRILTLPMTTRSSSSM